MKTFRLCTLISLMIVITVGLCGCGSKVDSKLCGDWAYIHDDVTTILSIESNGKAVYKGLAYTVSADDQYIDFKGGNGDMKLRYEIEDDGILIYERTVYEYDGETAPDGLVGNWVATPEGWTFEFTDGGEFKEDGYFPGYYTVDEANQSAKLIYNDHFEDTTIYYTIDGNELLMEYPWKMVKTK